MGRNIRYRGARPGAATSDAALAVAPFLRGPRHRYGPADAVTLVRAVMSGAVAGLVAKAAHGPLRRNVAVPLSAVALALDAVDGQVARRTGTASEFGARFDGETDAFLILVLTTQVSRSFGRWVLAGGIARYAFGAAGSVWPWMRRPLPRRWWRKVATATEGITLTVAMADILPRRAAQAGLAVGAALIAESFGRDVWWLWVRRQVPL